MRPCVACGPDATSGYCIFHDDLDRVYELLERAHAVVVGSPVYFDSVSGPLKILIDRCNCITPLVTLPGGTQDFVPRWKRTRRGAFVTACSSKHPHELAERVVRGYLKWVGGQVEGVGRGSTPTMTSPAPTTWWRAPQPGRRLVEGEPLR
jgi:multimeric flavodoxin WrbA